MKYLNILLILVPIVLVMEFLGIGGHSTIFVLSALSIIPLAAILGHGTQAVAVYTGPKIGGLLNATLGNAAELIITILALREGLTDVVRASISGAIVGNILLVLGAAIFLGGLKNGLQSFDSHVAGVNASIMALAAMALMIPAIFAHGSAEHRPSDNDIINLSDGTSIVLILLYGCYLMATVFRPQAMAPVSGESSSAPAAMEPAEHHTDGDQPKLPVALAMMGGAAISIVLMSEVLVGALEPTAESWGLTELFVGVILVPLVGNVAENIVAVQVAIKNNMDLSIGIAAGSAIQIALFVTPVLVLVSQFVGPEAISLVFNPFELVALGGAILIMVMISIDGRSNWLEGVELLGLYLMIALAFYFVP